ncbi:hypothetical protein GRS66_008363 [Saccharomyces pastorianus]|uniref:Nucleoporin Nup159/Nup146 N-terminal domain-containing protein n=1 Tax=Saccharomyces pastorianus TaxID=27292 RepID=A0A6C1E8W4_SACPS|nr:hypothetical protein GRS66_008363 [Saccharomyces pastorianus]
MSSLQDEVSTETSEDFGFKFLGQKQILPPFNEKPPFASLQNLAISNSKSLFIAASGNKVVIGELQMLKDHITSDSNPIPLVFKWENEVVDVIFVCFNGGQGLIATRDTLYSINLEKLGELQTVFSFETPICQLKDFDNTLIYLSTNNNLSTLDLKTKSTNQLAQNVASFDLANSQLLVLLKDRSFRNFSLQKGTPEKTFEFSIPSELDEFSVDEYAPLNVTILSKQIYLVVFGNPVSETDEEASYDQKMFIIKYTDGNASFQETFDIIPPFGQILRLPYVYNVTLPDLIKPAENVNILASSCSSEVSIWDSNDVIEPSQDAERAVLPISEETDMDTNPIGVAVDITSSGTISEPCPSVDTIERLPLVYILNNEGNLQIVGLFHVASIKNGNYNIKLESEGSEMPASGSNLPFTAPLTLERNNTVEQEQEKEQEKEQSTSSPSDNPFISPNTSGFSFLKKEQPSTSNSLKSQNASAFSASSFGSSGFSFSSLSNPSVDSGTASNEQSATGTAFGKPAFGKPAFGTFTKEPSIPASAFGKPSFGSAAFGSEVTAAEPSASAPAFGKPSFGKPAFGAVASESSTSESAFGKSSFGTPAFGTTANEPSTSVSTFGKPTFSSSPFASITKEFFDSGSAAAKPAVSALCAFSSKKNTEPSSTLFGVDPNTSKQTNTNAFSFGNSTLGPSGFSNALNSVDTGTNTISFGTPAFGSSGVSNFSNTDTHINFGTQSSPFSSQLGKTSPFSSLAKNSTEVETIEKGSASEVDDENDNEYDDEHDNEDDDSSISDNDLTDTTVEQTPSRLAELTSNTNNGVVEDDRPESSIGRLTETIKKSANININDLENPVFENNVKAKSESPFSAFTTNIKKPSSTTPAFSFGNSTLNNNSMFMAPSASKEVPSSSKEGTNNSESREKEALTSKDQNTREENPFLPKGKENDKETSEEESSQEESDASSESNGVNSENTPEQVFSTYNQQKDERKNVIPQDENIIEKLETGSKDSKHVAKYGDNPKSTDEASDTDENIDQETQEGEQEDGHGSEEEFEPNRAVKEFQDHNFEEDAVSEQDAYQNNETEDSGEDNPSTSDREESISESYDKLEDINTDEFPCGGEAPPVNDEEHSADSNVQTSLEKNYVESGIQTDLSESSQENEVQTAVVPVKHHYTQTVEKEVVDNDIQTEPVETSNFSVQAFEGDENYLAEQYKPKPLIEYYTGAKVSNIPFLSQNSTLRLIESTFQMVEAEFSVLKENIQNMDSFFIDQSSTQLETRTIHSVNNMYTWRIPEAELLSNILNDVKSEHMQVTSANVKKLEEKASSYIEKDIASVNDDLMDAKEQFLFLSHFNEASSEFVKDLSTHQFKMQTALRQKLSKVSAEINHVEEMLNILKLFSVKNKRLDENPLVAKLAKESFTRGGLLQEIKSLRDEVSRLQLKDESKETTSLESSSSLTKDINGSKVVEVGLTLNTKKQIGGFLKNLNLGKY